MGGVRRDPLERKILGGGGVKLEKPSVGGVWIFSGTTQCVRNVVWALSVRGHIEMCETDHGGGGVLNRNFGGGVLLVLQKPDPVLN